MELLITSIDAFNGAFADFWKIILHSEAASILIDYGKMLTNQFSSFNVRISRRIAETLHE